MKRIVRRRMVRQSVRKRTQKKDFHGKHGQEKDY
jgi:hypothetical protein